MLPPLCLERLSKWWSTASHNHSRVFGSAPGELNHHLQFLTDSRFKNVGVLAELLFRMELDWSKVPFFLSNQLSFSVLFIWSADLLMFHKFKYSFLKTPCLCSPLLLHTHTHFNTVLLLQPASSFFISLLSYCQLNTEPHIHFTTGCFHLDCINHWQHCGAALTLFFFLGILGASPITVTSTMTKHKPKFNW